jgi:hypothetical protein
MNHAGRQVPYRNQRLELRPLGQGQLNNDIEGHAIDNARQLIELINH